MEYSVEGGKRVYNVTLGDLPEYLPVSTTDFSGSYNYVADLERSQPADDGTTIVSVSGLRSDRFLISGSVPDSPVLPRAARAFPCPEVHRGRSAIQVQCRLTYPNYAKEMPHLFA